MSSKLNEKWDRLFTTIGLGTPDRVPFAPKVSLYYAYNYGPSVYDIMKDFRNAEAGVRQYAADFDPDLIWAPATYPIDPLEVLKPEFLKWPGPTHKIPHLASYQHLDNTWMEDEEFDEFLSDPTHFIITKLLPRKYKNLQGLKKLNFHEIYDMSFLATLNAFNDPEVRDTLMTLIRAGEHMKEKGIQAKYLTNIILNELEVPTRGATVCAPFDIYVDSLRGLIQGTMDTIEYPEETLECVNRIADFSIDRAVNMAKANGEKLVFIPLHAGVDDFMSLKNYEKFYWPTLKRLLMTIINAGMTPYVFCEGKYNTRLEVISDIPKGKVVYMFEQVDMKKVKETVGKVACIGGNMNTSTLAYGTKEQVIKETRELLDIGMPGGGFLMDCSLIIDNANHENMIAWRETTLKYGNY